VPPPGEADDAVAPAPRDGEEPGGGAPAARPGALPLAATPMMRQYGALKRRYPDHLLLFRLGDFYELFGEDARRAARLLSITLTHRQQVPMAGVPHHALDAYVGRLIRAGEKVAVCEQMEVPGRGKKLVRREVTRVITPGTVTDTQFLDGGANNFLLAVHRAGGRLGVALTDVSTGEFLVGEAAEDDGALLEAALLRRPAEVLLAHGAEPALAERLAAQGTPVTRVEPASFGPGAVEALRRHLQVSRLDGFGLGGQSAGVQAAGAAFAYLRETQGAGLGHLTRLTRFDPRDALVLDRTAVATLELLETAAERRVQGSLLGSIDATLTPMGARLLRQWLLRPLLDAGAIAERQVAVGVLVEVPAGRAALRRRLGAVGDLERLAGRAALGLAGPRELASLRGVLAELEGLRAAVPPGAPLLERLAEDLVELPALRRLLQDALADEPPRDPRAGGVIRAGWSPELEQIRETAREAKAWIAGLEGRERQRTGIASLRVRYNRVFGYGIEVGHAHTTRVPAEYVRRQTLVGAERYVTAELKDYESRALGAEERIARLELALFEDLRGQVAKEAPELLRLARAVAALDVLAALAEVAHARRWVRPVVDDSLVLDLQEGRHPVLEAEAARSGEPVTPNDLHLDPASAQIVVVTGPNMSGKSVYMRQTALLVLLAQAGSWVPARAARVGLVDRILTRVGAQDNLARGQSTFLVEMVETASILHNVTPRSLVLLDEVGRGTSTGDGLAIAWAVTEELHDRGQGAKVLFATHFHELTALAERLPRVRNCHVAVREWNDEIVFLHTVRPGGTDRSYGIQVARLAGLPRAVIERARALLEELAPPRLPAAAAPAAAGPAQLALFPPTPDPLLRELAALDVASLTPLAALNLLAEWQRRLRERP
jgi:DNA mismatch repair protein MutS